MAIRFPSNLHRARSGILHFRIPIREIGLNVAGHDRLTIDCPSILMIVTVREFLPISNMIFWGGQSSINKKGSYETRASGKQKSLCSVGLRR
jgi:hypothetical protein